MKTTYTQKFKFKSRQIKRFHITNRFSSLQKCYSTPINSEVPFWMSFHKFDYTQLLNAFLWPVIAPCGPLWYLRPYFTDSRS